MSKLSIRALLAVSLLVVQPATAGPLYGTVRMGPNAAPGLTIYVACPGFSAPAQTITAATDGNGSYSMLVRATGRCEMRVSNGSVTGAAFEVFLSDNPLGFDFAVDGAMNRVS